MYRHGEHLHYENLRRVAGIGTENHRSPDLGARQATTLASWLL